MGGGPSRPGVGAAPAGDLPESLAGRPGLLTDAVAGIPFEGGKKAKSPLGEIITANDFERELTKSIVGGREDTVVSTIEQTNQLLEEIKATLDPRTFRPGGAAIYS